MPELIDIHEAAVAEFEVGDDGEGKEGEGHEGVFVRAAE